MISVGEHIKMLPPRPSTATSPPPLVGRWRPRTAQRRSTRSEKRAQIYEKQAGKGTSSAREQQRSCHESTRGGIQGGATLGPCRHVSLTQKSWRAAPRKLETEEEVSNSTKKYRPCCRCRWSPYTASSGGVTAALGAAFRPRYGGAAPTVAATRMQRGQSGKVPA